MVRRFVSTFALVSSCEMVVCPQCSVPTPSQVRMTVFLIRIAYIVKIKKDYFLLLLKCIKSNWNFLWWFLHYLLFQSSYYYTKCFSMHLAHFEITSYFFYLPVIFCYTDLVLELRTCFSPNKKLLYFRFCEYLLSCPSTEVRSAFMKIIVFLAHFSLQDGPCAPPMLDAPSKYCKNKSFGSVLCQLYWWNYNSVL